MVPTSLLLRESSPQRPPTWRWDLAGTLASAPQAELTAQDDWVRTARRIQDENRSGATESAVAAAIASLGPVADAYAFWLNGRTAAAGTPNKPDDYTPVFGPLTPAALALAELEALVLADKKPASIAKHTGLSVPAVLWYERLWFDVRSRLKQRGWVANAVIGTLHQGNLGTLLPALIRAYGYFTKSARIVSALVSGFDARVARNAAQSPESFFAADAMAAGGMKAALAVRLMPLNDRRTHARVVELHQEATRIAADATALAGNDDENKLRAAVNVLTDRVKFKYGKAPAPATEPLKISAHKEEAG